MEIEGSTAPAPLSPRERQLVAAVREYLGEIEECQAILFRVARRALTAAMADLDLDGDIIDPRGTHLPVTPPTG